MVASPGYLCYIEGMIEIDRGAPRKLELVPPNSDILNRVASAVILNEIGTQRMDEIIDGMLELARGEQGNPDRPTLVGLAAPQVGISERIIVVGVDATGRGEEPTFRAYLNPEIIDQSRDQARDREGCYSTGEFCGILYRRAWVTIRALDRHGEPVQEIHEGIPARIFQHEIHHLDGIRFPDRITDDKDLLRVRPEQFGEFRTDWANWPHKASRADWEALKSGHLKKPS